MRYVFFNLDVAQPDSFLTINGDGTWSVEHTGYRGTVTHDFDAMLAWMGDDPQPTTIEDFIKDGLHRPMSAVSIETDDGLMMAYERPDSVVVLDDPMLD